MSDVKISALPAAVSVADADLISIVQGGTTKKATRALTVVDAALGTPASGVATNLTGTASGLTAGNVTTNANLTGPITSSGNATSIASQTGTGTKFVVDTSPTIASPTLSGTTTLTGATSFTLDASGAAGGTISATGGSNIIISAPLKFTGAIRDSANGLGANGQGLKSNGSGILTYGSDNASYCMQFGNASGSIAASTTTYVGMNTSLGVSSLGVQGRFKAYIPKTGTIKTIIFQFYGAAGDGGHSITFDIWLNNATSVGSTAIVSNVFPGFGAATGLTQAVTGNGVSGDSIEFRIVAPSGMTTVTGFTAMAMVYIETAV